MQKTLQELFPHQRSYKEEDWYLQIMGGWSRYKITLIRRALMVSIFIPLIYMIYRFIAGDDSYSVLGIVALFFLVVLWLASFKIKETWMVPICCIFFYLQWLSGFLNSQSDFHFIGIIVIPILGIQLLGPYKGSAYSFLFPVSMICISAISSQSDSSLLLNQSDPGLLILSSLSFGLVLLSNLVIYRHHQNNLRHMINNTLFDKVTLIPAQKVLKTHLRHVDQGIFAIIRVVNFAELGLIFGYELSDTILVHVSETLGVLGRDMDFKVYRLRGSEFGILKECKDDNCDEKAEAFLLQLYHKIENLGIHWQESHLTLNFQVGGTLLNHDPEDYLSHADMAIKEGIERHCPVVLFNGESTIREKVLNSIHHYSTLRENLEEETLEAYFQPIIDSKTQEIIWYETLLRVRDPQGNMGSPLPYLNVAESTGLDRYLSDFVLQQACKALKVLKTHVSINVTFNDLKRPEFLETLEAWYPKEECGDGKLILEILERQELHTLDSCQTFLHRAKELGCKIAIDDFGSGYSNYCNVLKIPVDIIKIDGGLVQQLPENPKAQVLIHNIVEFSKKLQLKVVAEYVDCQDIAKTLKELGVDFMQGWLYGKAQPLEMEPKESYSIL